MSKIILTAITLLTLTACFENKSTKTELTPSQALGQKLYFDPRLSKDGTISCNTCHNVMQGGDDSRAVSAGINGLLGGRSAPTVFNAVFLSVQFWDGRAKDLKEQAKGPITNPIEMGSPSHDFVVARLKKIPGYVKEFEKVYGKDSLNIENAAQAIADYEATLTTLNSPYDLGKMTAKQTKGFETFKEVGCASCHSGDHFAGPKMPIGTGFFQKFPTYANTAYDQKYQFTKDTGRMQVTGKEEDKFMFRVPTLRNIGLTAPYFHNGAVATLDEAIKVMAKTQLNRDLTQEQTDSISSFLNALSGTIPEQTMPTLPPTPGKSLVTDVN